MPNIGLTDPARGRRLARAGRPATGRSTASAATSTGPGRSTRWTAFEAQALGPADQPARRPGRSTSTARARQRPRPLRPQPVGPAAPAWPAGWSRPGVDVVTTTLDGPLCGRVANWDDHAVNHHVFDALKFRAAGLRPGGDGPDRGRLRARPRPAGAGGRDRRVRPDAADLLRGQQRRRGGQRGGRHGPAGPRPLAAGQLDALGRRRDRDRAGHRRHRPPRART